MKLCHIVTSIVLSICLLLIVWISTLGPEVLPEDVTLAPGQTAPDLTSVVGETESENNVNEKIPTAERRNSY